MSGFKRFSLASCALLLSLSNVAYADTETSTETPSTDYEKGYILTPVDTQGANTITKYIKYFLNFSIKSPTHSSFANYLFLNLENQLNQHNLHYHNQLEN